MKCLSCHAMWDRTLLLQSFWKSTASESLGVPQGRRSERWIP